MNRHHAELVAVLVSLLAFGIANADIEFAGVIDPLNLVTRYDSVKLVSPDMTFLTLDWGSDTPYDTFVFAGVAAWPETLWMHGTIQGFPMHNLFINMRPDTWYTLCLGPIIPRVMFLGDYGGVEDSRPSAASMPRLTVSPSVVTGQVTFRLRPVGTGRPVVQIHDAVGNLVRSLECTAGSGGTATAIWNREDELGRLVPEGVYFCRYAAAGVIAVRKVLVVH